MLVSSDMRYDHPQLGQTLCKVCVCDGDRGFEGGDGGDCSEGGDGSEGGEGCAMMMRTGGTEAGREKLSETIETVGSTLQPGQHHTTPHQTTSHKPPPANLEF